MIEICDDYVFWAIERKLNWTGFANVYIVMSWDNTDMINKADFNIYKELITIDEKLGTKMTEQLLRCVKYSFRKDLFKVWIFFLFFEYFTF